MLSNNEIMDGFVGSFFFFGFNCTDCEMVAITCFLFKK